MGESGTIDRKRLLIRLRPFMYGDLLVGQASSSSPPGSAVCACTG